MTGKEQARLLGLFFWLLTGFQLLVVAVIGIFYFFFFGVMMATMPHRASDPPPELILPIIVVFMIVLFVVTMLMAIPKIVAGYGLRNEKSWAKVWAIVACVMSCMNFPFGTAVGVFGLVFILGDAGKAYFDSASIPRAPSGIQPPTPNSWQQ
jgi:hypothetical protein